jgi:hypothetical protein
LVETWNRNVFKNIFRDIGINYDGTVTHDEFANFSINASLKGISIRQLQLDFQFGAYDLLELPRACACGGQSITESSSSAERFGFDSQSNQLLALQYLSVPKLFLCHDGPPVKQP